MDEAENDTYCFSWHTRKLSYRKDGPAMRPVYVYPEKFGSPQLHRLLYFPQNCSCAFDPIDPMNVHTKFEVRSFRLPVPEIIGDTPEKNWTVP